MEINSMFIWHLNRCFNHSDDSMGYNVDAQCLLLFIELKLAMRLLNFEIAIFQR